MSTDAGERAMVAPAHLHRPARARSLVREVTRVCASVGRHLDAEQQLAVDVLTGLRADGTPAALEAAVISARQNLKTFVLEGIALTLLLDPHNHVSLGIWSAQEFDTAQETFRHFVDLFESDDYPHLTRRVKDIRRGSGKEEIELVGGRRLKFKARSGKGARGLTGDFVVLDEAFALDPVHMGALLPTLSTRRRAMVFYGSSAGKADSAVLAGIRDRGRAGTGTAPAYVEWCAPGSLQVPGCDRPDCQHSPGIAGCVLDREDYWLCANPALGRRITLDYLRRERAALPPAEFARERLGWWDELDLGAVPVDLDAWDACRDLTSTVVGQKVWALDVTPSGSWTAIAVAGARPDGLAHVELMESRPGTGWVVDRIAELVQRHDTCRIPVGDKDWRTGVLVDPSGPAGDLLPLLRGAGLQPYVITARDLGQACGGLANSVREKQVMHIGQDQVRAALGGAVRRDIGDGAWAFARKSSGLDISPIVAVTMALHGLRLSESAPAQPFFASRR